MNGVENMDGEFEPTTLDMFIDWNDDTFQPTFLHSDTPHTAFQNFEETITELAAVPTPAVAESMVEITDPTSWSYEGSSSAAALSFVPNPLPQLLPHSLLLNAAQSNLPSSSAEGLMLEGPVPSVQGQKITQTGYFNQLSDLQNENLLALQSIDLYDEQNPCTQRLIPNRMANNSFNGINNQPSPYPALVHQNPVQARPGNSEREYSSGPFAPPKRHTLFTQHNDISNSHAEWSSSPEHTQFSAPVVYGAQYAPNYTQMPQSFTPVHDQVGHASELQQILDLLSQNPMRPVYPMCPRSEPYSNLQPGFVIMPTNAYQRGYRPVLPDPAAPSASYLANYGQQSSLFATTTNSFGSRSSVPPTNEMSPGVPNQISEYNPRIRTTSDLQRQNNISLQANNSRIPGHLSTRTTEGSSAQVSNSWKAEIAPVLRTQPSEAIRRILNMNPTRTVTRNTPCITEQIQSKSLPIKRVRYETQCPDRPRKRCDAKGSSSQRGKSLKVSTETGKRGTTGTSQRAQRTPDSVVNRDPNAVLPNPLSAPRHFENAVYDMEFERKGQLLEPHLRLFKPPPEN